MFTVSLILLIALCGVAGAQTPIGDEEPVPVSYYFTVAPLVQTRKAGGVVSCQVVPGGTVLTKGQFADGTWLVRYSQTTNNQAKVADECSNNEEFELSTAALVKMKEQALFRAP